MVCNDVIKNMDRSKQHNKYRILVVDFGSQYTRLLLRRIRALGVYSEIDSWNISRIKINQFNPNGIILSGGPCSVTDDVFPNVPEFIFQLGIPILGICYGMQIMTVQLGGSVQSGIISGEFGSTRIKIIKDSMLIHNVCNGVSLNKLENITLDVWMSHGDTVTIVPPEFSIVAVTQNEKIAIIANEQSRLYGVQFHPEVTHTEKGIDILECFVMDVCCCKPVWTSVNITNSIVSDIKLTVGNDRVVLAFSGGIDSFVVALLLKRAIGNRCICIFVDNGLLLHNVSYKFLNKFFKKYCDLNIIYVSEEQRFLQALVGIIDPEEKRKIIGKVFLDVLEEQMRNLVGITWLAQGTIYSDVIESGISGFSFTNKIKSHHNVGGLPDIINFRLLEPIRYLFKDEVRAIGLDLGLPCDIIYRYPFPGPGLAIRILGEVKKEYCSVLRQADLIFSDELKKQNLYSKISQAFAVFLPINSVGVKGDRRKYKWVIALRAVETVDFMTARWVRFSYDFLDKVSYRIVNEVEGISRVVYDISCKPPATIEWE